MKQSSDNLFPNAMTGTGLDNPTVMEFAVFCIENLAKRQHKGAETVYAELADKSDLLSSYVVPSYDFLHTQDKEYILDDIERAMAVKAVATLHGEECKDPVIAAPTLSQMKFARIVTKFAAKEKIPAEEAQRFFYYSRLSPLLRDGVADLHCMSDEYIVDDLAREYKGT